MDVERIQKVNNLALDLMKQGLATSRDEAIAQAEKIFRQVDTEEYRSLQETIGEAKTNQSSEQSSSNTVVEKTLAENDIKNILKQNADFLVRKIRDFQEKITSLEKEMTELRTKLTYQRLPTVEDVKKQSQNQRNDVNPAEATPPPSHPRSGNYKDEDVSIEKFFYMGSK